MFLRNVSIYKTVLLYFKIPLSKTCIQEISLKIRTKFQTTSLKESRKKVDRFYATLTIERINYGNSSFNFL